MAIWRAGFTEEREVLVRSFHTALLSCMLHSTAVRWLAEQQLVGLASVVGEGSTARDALLFVWRQPWPVVSSLHASEC
jgi:hypothetical protein